jgi:hypothetical protein
MCQRNWYITLHMERNEICLSYWKLFFLFDKYLTKYKEISFRLLVVNECL